MRNILKRLYAVSYLQLLSFALSGGVLNLSKCIFSRKKMQCKFIRCITEAFDIIFFIRHLCKTMVVVTDAL